MRAIWYPSTVASVSYFCKQKIKTALEKSSDNLAGLGFKLHDFGARGASSLETVALGGLAHLVNFMGTDSVCLRLSQQSVGITRLACLRFRFLRRNIAR